VAQAAHPGAANPFESGLRAILLECGLLGFEPQYRVPGTSYVVDLADPVQRVCLEADSFAHHASRGALRNDCRRYDELTRLGWVLLRFAWEHVMFEQAWVGEVVADCCRRR
jgi:very-short-patch-repair endonuclease